MKLRNIFKGRQDRQDEKEKQFVYTDEMGEKGDNAAWRLGILGFNLSRHRADRFLLDDFLKESRIGEVFCSEFGPGKIESIFTYRRDEQDDEHKTIVGHANYIKTDAGKCHVIGLSAEALERGPMYATAILLHELAHIKVDESGGNISAHDDTFKEAVKRVVEQYEAATGRKIPYDVGAEKVG